MAAVRTAQAIEIRAWTALIQIVWEFIVRENKIQEFERHYSSSGSWAEMFRRNEGYHGTVLSRDKSSPRRYLTIDNWDSVAAFQNMRAQVADEYAALDRKCADLTEAENYLGTFENA